jgi:hypothetical protein
LGNRCQCSNAVMCVAAPALNVDVHNGDDGHCSPAVTEDGRRRFVSREPPLPSVMIENISLGSGGRVSIIQCDSPQTRPRSTSASSLDWGGGHGIPARPEASGSPYMATGPSAELYVLDGLCILTLHATMNRTLGTGGNFMTMHVALKCASNAPAVSGLTQTAL